MNLGDSLAWARLTEDDWHLSFTLLRRNRLPVRAICFRAQQSAEKYLKALLVSCGVYFPEPHDLAFLKQLCEQHGILTGFVVEDLALLSDFTVQVRYPGGSQARKKTVRRLRLPGRCRALPVAGWDCKTAKKNQRCFDLQFGEKSAKLVQ